MKLNKYHSVNGNEATPYYLAQYIGCANQVNKVASIFSNQARERDRQVQNNQGVNDVQPAEGSAKLFVPCKQVDGILSDTECLKIVDRSTAPQIRLRVR